MTVMTNASCPPEARGTARDGVRLLVAGAELEETVFRQLPRFLAAGDLLVVNTSATLAAALDGQRADGSPVVVHVASHLDDGSWVVEVRPPAPSFGPVRDVRAGERLTVHGAHLTVCSTLPDQDRLHVVTTSADLHALMTLHGRPIAYGYVPDPWPLTDYQTVFATEPGSAEMPSAARPFTRRLVTQLVSTGVLFAPVLLHTGVSSLEEGEHPQPEQFRVGERTAALVEHVRSTGGRVVAVGTTATRALESVTEPDGSVHAGQGWTDLVLGPDRPARVVDGLITGWHEPGGSHVQLLEAVAGADLVALAYAEAAARQLLWHEFGDSCLLLPAR